MRKAFLAAVSTALLLVSTMVGVTPATAAPKLPVKVSFLSSTQIPAGSQDFHFTNNAQGSHFAQWIVKTTNNSNQTVWQIWTADFEPSNGTLLNQTKTYELPAGTVFQSKPVVSNFPNSVGVVYSTYWETDTDAYSRVEVVTLEANGASQHQVLDKFPTLQITKGTMNFEMCNSFDAKCGYQKVAVGGDNHYQTTVAVLENVGQYQDARIGLSTSAYFRNQYWSDPYYIASNAIFNFDVNNAFTWGLSGGVYFVYVTRDSSNSIAVRKIYTSNVDPQTVTDPQIVSRIVGGQNPKVTYLSATRSVITWLNTDYSALEVWTAPVDTENDNYGNDYVVYNNTFRFLGDSDYHVKKVSGDTFQVLLSMNDGYYYDKWSVAVATVNLADGANSNSVLLQGDDNDTRPAIGESYTAPDGSFGTSVKVRSGETAFSSVWVYSPDFGLVPVPVKAKKATVLGSSIFGWSYDSSLLSTANVRLGTQEFLEVTRIQSKAVPTSIAPFGVYNAREVGSTATVGNPVWSSASYLGTTSYQWVRCSVRLVTKVVGLPKACKKIQGANQATYVLTTADRGKFVSVILSAQNRNGASSVVAASSKKVK